MIHAERLALGIMVTVLMILFVGMIYALHTIGGPWVILSPLILGFIYFIGAFVHDIFGCS